MVHSLLRLAFVLALCHCGVAMVRTTNDAPRPPKNPADVAIFTEPPADRPFREVGEFTYQELRTDSDAAFTERLQRAAAKEGCDAVWIRPNESRSVTCLYYDGPAPARRAHADHAPRTMHHSFADAERWAREFDAPDRDTWQKPDEVVALMAIAPGSTVVDLGAGTGYFLPRLSAAVGKTGRAIGLDIEPNMVEYMKRRAERERLANVEARVVAADGSDLPRGVDRVLIVDTWHHLENRLAYSKNLYSAINAGGAVIVVDFTHDAPKGPPPAHRLAPETVMAELVQGGFKAETARESLPHQYVVIGRK